jgi:hypothetical protein
LSKDSRDFGSEFDSAAFVINRVASGGTSFCQFIERSFVQFCANDGLARSGHE